MPDLNGRVVAFLEGRRATELADLISRHGGIPIAAPCLREVHSPDAPHLQAGLRQALAAQPRVTIFLTGVGTNTLFEAAQHAGIEDEWRAMLDKATVVVRGPKPTAALRRFGVRIDLTAPAPNTTAEVLGVLDACDLSGQTVLVQLYGEPNSLLTQALGERGASVIELAPYVWDRPTDPQPILRLLDALDTGSVDVLLVTSQAQVDTLYGVATDAGRTPRLDGVAIGPQGPVAEAALARRGLAASFRPTHGSMGALVLAAAAHFGDESSTRQQVTA
ncbi:MAG: hypothetical protein NVSMB2_20220 [Chloroflexota bacterium]